MTATTVHETAAETARVDKQLKIFGRAYLAGAAITYTGTMVYLGQGGEDDGFAPVAALEAIPLALLWPFWSPGVALFHLGRNLS